MKTKMNLKNIIKVATTGGENTKLGVRISKFQSQNI